jgi:hypothetical protein
MMLAFFRAGLNAVFAVSTDMANGFAGGPPNDISKFFEI